MSLFFFQIKASALNLAQSAQGVVRFYLDKHHQTHQKRFSPCWNENITYFLMYDSAVSEIVVFLRCGVSDCGINSRVDGPETEAGL